MSRRGSSPRYRTASSTFPAWRAADARIRRSRVLGQDAETKTRKSRRDVVLHGPVVDLLRETWPLLADHDDFVFTTPSGRLPDARVATSAERSQDQAEALLQYEALLRDRDARRRSATALGREADGHVARDAGEPVRPRPEDRGGARCAPRRGPIRQDKKEPRGNLVRRQRFRRPFGRLRKRRKPPKTRGFPSTAGDRDRTGDVQLGKLRSGIGGRERSAPRRPRRTRFQAGLEASASLAQMYRLLPIRTRPSRNGSGAAAKVSAIARAWRRQSAGYAHGRVLRTRLRVSKSFEYFPGIFLFYRRGEFLLDACVAAAARLKPRHVLLINS